MGDVFEPVQVARDRVDRHGNLDLWVRRILLILLTGVVVLALLNVFGQRATDATTKGVSADLSLHAPSRVRPGLLFQARITVVAHRALPRARLVLGPGWFDGLTLNTAEPSVTETSTADGGVAMSLGRLAAGQVIVEYLEYQVNPTSFSGRSQAIALQSDGVPVVTLRHSLTIIP